MEGICLKKPSEGVLVVYYQLWLGRRKQAVPDLLYSAAVALACSSGAASMKPPDCRFHSAA